MQEEGDEEGDGTATGVKLSRQEWGGGRGGERRLTGVGSRLAFLDVCHSFRISHHVPQTIARDDEPAVVGRKSNFMKERLGRYGACSTGQVDKVN